MGPNANGGKCGVIIALEKGNGVEGTADVGSVAERDRRVCRNGDELAMMRQSEWEMIPVR